MISLLLCAGAANAADGLSAAIENVRTACSGISDKMADMKTKAGINTAITGVGTVAGGVALGTGIAKSGVDDEIEKLEKSLEKLRNVQVDKTQVKTISVGNKDDFREKIKKDFSAISIEMETNAKIAELTKQSKSLGNWRTGTMAGAAVTNIAGAVVAGSNRVKGDLQSQINNCVAATKTLLNVKMQARIDGDASESELQRADKIVSACSEWELVDLSKINNRAKGATISSAIGATTGVVGTITSASANTDTVRNDDSDSGQQKEKNLNTASNILAGTTTAASGVATVFNATQISAIKRAASVADECEGALR